jgi:uroporphyrinogen-III synthase
MSRPVLIIRPEPGFTATSERLKAMGLAVSGAPLFAVESVKWEAPDPARYAGILFTSANAVRHAGPALQSLIHLPVFAVGEATANAASEAGFASVVTGERDVAWIVARIGTLGPQSILHLTGKDTTPFDAMGVQIDRVTVYDSVAQPLPLAWDEWLSHSPIALVHSPRAAALFASHCASKDKIALIAISDAAAQAAGAGWESVDVAGEPRDEAMLDLARLRA